VDNPKLFDWSGSISQIPSTDITLRDLLVLALIAGRLKTVEGVDLWAIADDILKGRSK